MRNLLLFFALFSFAESIIAQTQDLVAEQVSVTPVMGTTKDKEYTFSVAIKNSGTAAAIFRYGSRIFSCDKIVRDQGAYPSDVRIDPGNSKVYTFSLYNTLAPGTYVVNCVIDPDKKVPEQDRTNNAFSFSWTVTADPSETGKPDLVVSYYKFSPQPATTVDRIMFDARIVNRGTASAYFYTDKSYALLTGPQSNWKWNDKAPFPMVLAPKDSLSTGQYIFEPGVLPAGSYVFKLDTDADQAVDESDETNNSASSTLTITDAGFANLVAEQVSVTPVMGTTKDKNYTFSVAIKNSGTAAAIFRYGSRIFSCDKIVRDQGASPSEVRIDPGNSQVFTFWLTYALAPGTYVVNCVIDPDKKVPEQDRTNNAFSFSWTVTADPSETGKPDLVVSLFKFSPQPATTADRIMFDARIVNRGTASAYFYTDQSYALLAGSQSNWRWNSKVPFPMVLAPKDSLSTGQYIFEPGELPAGSYVFKLDTDVDQAVDESDEINNSMSSTLVMMPAGSVPVLLGITVAPGSVTAGTSAVAAITLDRAAPLGGVIVTLASNVTNAAVVPPTVIVGEGEKSAIISVATGSVPDTTAVTISASCGGVTKTGALIVNPIISRSSKSALAAQTGPCDAGCFTTTVSGAQGGRFTGHAVVEVDVVDPENGGDFSLVLRSSKDEGRFIAFSRWSHGGRPRAGTTYTLANRFDEGATEANKPDQFSAEYFVNAYHEGEIISFNSKSGTLTVDEMTKDRIIGRFAFVAGRWRPDGTQEQTRLQGTFNALWQH